MGQIYQANMGISTRKRGWSVCSVKARKECGLTQEKGGYQVGDGSCDDFMEVPEVPAIRSRQMDVASGAFVSMVVVAPK